MKFLQSHLRFSRTQRDGILSLVMLNFGLLAVYLWVDFDTPVESGFTDELIQEIQREIDSLKLVAVENSKPKLYPFNPNFLTDYKAYTLGMSPKEFDRLSEFRSSDKWINSVSEFQEVTGVSDSLLAQMESLFKFPDWVTNQNKTTYKNSSFGNKELPESQRTDLNTASIEQLRQIQGIGEILSKRIIAYRDKLGGFAANDELYAVYGLKPEVIDELLGRFTVKTPRDLIGININKATASDIATIPGISFELAKEIWEFVRLRERIESMAELEKLPDLSDQKLRLISVYLYAE